MKKAIVLVALLIAGGVFGFVKLRDSAKPAVVFRTAPVKRGDVVVTIGATGTVEPEEVVDVGAQVAGKIELFGKDPKDGSKIIDYGTTVDEGTVLAHIDESLYAADVDSSAAQVAQAKANVLRSKADLEQMRAKLHQAEQNWKRAQELGNSRALSATDYDSYEAAYETAKATLAVGDATVVQAETAVNQEEAALKRAKTNLSYCTIKSPVKGVIIDRRVNIGQTVVSSLNAPSLFLIAKDLKRMQVWASVNEADIGSIRPRQAVTFGVDAYPGEEFRGEVGKIRLNASMTQNVVTYTVEITTDNSSGKLLPYLTANVHFEVAQKKDVLTVPTAALRWAPSSPQLIVPDARQSFANAGRPKPATKRTAGAGGKNKKPFQAHGTIWIQDGEFARPITVATGLSDTASTEIQGDDLKEGSEVIIGEAPKNGGDDQTTNPFTPQFFGGGRRS